MVQIISEWRTSCCKFPMSMCCHRIMRLYQLSNSWVYNFLLPPFEELVCIFFAEIFRVVSKVSVLLKRVSRCSQLFTLYDVTWKKHIEDWQFPDWASEILPKKHSGSFISSKNYVTERFLLIIPAVNINLDVKASVNFLTKLLVQKEIISILWLIEGGWNHWGKKNPKNPNSRRLE